MKIKELRTIHDDAPLSFLSELENSIINYLIKENGELPTSDDLNEHLSFLLGRMWCLVKWHDRAILKYRVPMIQEISSEVGVDPDAE